ncbi:hypothetical protein R84981_002830 [Carnimonas sp. R-84981]|uniref:DUF2213 domain-containing protein n=1 Tax=Carnimonas bestiolae TaxID=3402172 RepID=UPI003EDC7BE4
MKYLFNTRLGETRYRLSDGSLLTKDVPIARTGEQIYIGDELPDIEPGTDGLIRIERNPEEVFDEATIASFEGMSLTLDHPADTQGQVLFIDPTNWGDLAVGHVQNVRRGEGLDSNLLIADLVWKRDAAIQAIDEGLREVSCGYDAQYEQTAPGHAKQTRITGNHVALVNKGRAGSRCAIGDKDTMPTQPHGLKGTFLSVWSRIAKTADAADLEALEPFISTGDEETGKTTAAPPNYSLPPQDQDSGVTTGTGDDDSMKQCMDRLAALEEAVSKLTSASTGDDASDVDEDDAGVNMADSAPKVTADAMSRAEIIVPGFKGSKENGDLAYKRSVLDAADEELVRQVVGDSAIKDIPDGSVNMAFNAVSALAKLRNTRSVTKDSASSKGAFTPAEMNAAAKAFWSKR